MTKNTGSISFITKITCGFCGILIVEFWCFVRIYGHPARVMCSFTNDTSNVIIAPRTSSTCKKRCPVGGLSMHHLL